ncbi:hypothetical protein ABI59_07740 [Acidobacteria bacterium Mor1]|nr:hypothetical protein ABI59_07740 [Acidobacteria bacterium Mor1]
MLQRSFTRRALAVALLAILGAVWLPATFGHEHDHVHGQDLGHEEGDHSAPCATCVVESAHAEDAPSDGGCAQPAPAQSRLVAIEDVRPDGHTTLRQAGRAPPAV